MSDRIAAIIALGSLFACSTAHAQSSSTAEAFIAKSVKTDGDLKSLIKDLNKLPVTEQQKLLRILKTPFAARIIGGIPVEISKHPWQVALVRSNTSLRYQFCGGSLIRPDVVVTAAHCVDNPRVLKTRKDSTWSQEPSSIQKRVSV